MKLTKYNIDKINTQNRLIMEYNNLTWIDQIKSNIRTVFNVAFGTEDNIISDDISDGPISVRFKYKSDQTSNYYWNCEFSFDQENSSYHCVTSNGSATVSGAVTTDIQKAIKDLIPEAKSKIISEDNRIFTA